LQPDQGRVQRDHPDFGYTQVIGHGRRVGGKVFRRLALEHADVQRHRRSVAYQEHLRDVKDTASTDAVVVLAQSTSDEDVLHAPSEPLVVAAVNAF
jgi:hypothetical protein